MGFGVVDEKELPEYSNIDANKVLKIDPNGIYVQWLAETIDLPVQTGNANKLLTTNGTTAAWTTNLSATSSVLTVGSTAGNGANLMTLNQNGPANFNVITPDYSAILLPVTDTTQTSLSNYFIGMDFNESTGVLVMTNSTQTSGQTRVYVSGATGTANYLTSYTTFTDSAFVGMLNIRSVVYGNNTWAILGHTAGTRQLYYTTTASALTGWTRIADAAPWNVSRTPTKLKFINNQFIALFNAGSVIRISSDAVSWTELTINATGYQLSEIEYLPELRRYVIGLNAAGFLYYNNTTIPTGGATFTFVSVTNGQCNTLVWSSKLGLLMSQNNSGLINYSRDGVSWTSYTAPGTWNFANMIWINDFGGFFVSTLFQTTNNLAFSRDGFTWTLINNGFANQGIRLLYNKTNKFIINGMGNICVFKNLSSVLSTYLDPEATYATYNSNLKLRDNIEYEPQVITTATANTHFTTQSFTRSVISFNTTNANANIYLQGASFNGRIGTKFKIVKTVSVNNGVRIHPYEACRIVTPPASMLNYNITNSIYDLIPQNYYGSFELTRVNDETDGIYTGTWLVDNVNVYPLLGGQRYTTNVEVGGDLSVAGSVNFAGATFSGNVTIAENLATSKSYKLYMGGTGSYIEGDSQGNSSILNVVLNDTDMLNMSTSNFWIRNSNLYIERGIINNILVFFGPGTTHTVSRTTAPIIILGKPSTGTGNVRIQFPLSTDVPDGFQVRILVWDFPNHTGTGNKQIYFTGSGTSDNAFLLKQSGSDVLTYNTAHVLLEGTIIDVVNARSALSRWLVCASSWIV